jgi:hypothetical protein
MAKSQYIGSTQISLEIKLNDGEVLETPLVYTFYGFSKSIYRACKGDESKIKKSLEKYLSKNQNVPLVIENTDKTGKNINTLLIPRNSIYNIKLIYKGKE